MIVVRIILIASLVFMTEAMCLADDFLNITRLIQRRADWHTKFKGISRGTERG
jgi:hypothetical protein